MSDRARFSVLLLPVVLWGVFEAGVDLALNIVVLRSQTLPLWIQRLAEIDSALMHRLLYIFMVSYPTIMIAFVLLGTLENGSLETTATAGLRGRVSRLKSRLTTAAILWASCLSLLFLLPYSYFLVVTISIWSIFISHGALVESVYAVQDSLYRGGNSNVPPGFLAVGSFVIFLFLLFWGLLVPIAVFLRGRRIMERSA